MKRYTIVIFGGTGDLTKRKLIPSMNAIVNKNKDIKLNIIGIGRRDYTQEIYQEIVTEYLTDKLEENLTIHYHNSDIEKDETFETLKHTIEDVEKGGVDGRIFYLSTSYSLFENIARKISMCCNTNPKTKDKYFTHIIAEKPFGHDLESSEKLNSSLRKYFSEEQIYRADHYLAKDTVDNIIRVRFSNPLFEGVWNSKFISKVRVVVDEELGVGNRLGYYDTAGAIKDMVQNHLLQTLSLVMMEAPDSMEEIDFERAKIEAVASLKYNGEIITGQYDGYQEEVKDINPGSKTETFVELKLTSEAERWKGTEFILRTGKKLKKREAYIEIEFKKEPCTMYCNFKSSPNKLILHIQPREDIELLLNTKLPGEKVNISPVKMTFSPSAEFNANSPEGYEVIIEECLAKNKRIFISDEEIRYAWIVTDEIIESIKSTTPKKYKPGSDGLKLE